MGANTRNWIDLAQDRDYWRALVNMELEADPCLIPSYVKKISGFHHHQKIIFMFVRRDNMKS